MQYSLVLAAAALGVSATPALNLARQSHSDGRDACLPGIPPTNVSLSAPGLDFSFALCCPGIVSNGGDDSVCLVGDCGVDGADDGTLTTTGSCIATVPITASDYPARISSAYSAAGKPSVHNSAMVTGEQTGADGSVTHITATGVPATRSGSGASHSPSVTSMSTTSSAAGSASSTSSAAANTTSSAAPTSTAASGDAPSLRTTQGSVAALVMLALGAALL